MDQLVSYLNGKQGASEPCNKESVLTFIAKRVQQKKNVMISFFMVTPGQNGQSKDAKVDNTPHGQPWYEMDASISSSTDEDEVAPVELPGEQEV